MPDPATSRSGRPRSLTVAAALALLAAAGAAIMAVAHMGVDVPLLPTQGLGRAVPPAAAAFTVGTLVFAAGAWGLTRRRRWAWWLCLLAFAMALQGSAMPYRGVGSAVGIVIATAGIAALLMRGTRVQLGAAPPEDAKGP